MDTQCLTDEIPEVLQEVSGWWQIKAQFMPPVSHNKVWDLEQSFKGILDPNNHWSLRSYLILDPKESKNWNWAEFVSNGALPSILPNRSFSLIFICHFSLFSFQRWHNYTEMWLLNGPLLNLLWISSIFTKVPIIFLILM